jgi:hypothetical protein
MRSSSLVIYPDALAASVFCTFVPVKPEH